MKLSELPQSNIQNNNHTAYEAMAEATKICLSRPQRSYEIIQNIRKDIDADNINMYIKYLSIKSMSLWYIGYFHESYMTAQELLLLAKKHNNEYYQAWAYTYLGNSSFYLDNLEEALLKYNNGLKLARSSQNIKAEQNILNKIGRIYLRLNSNELANEYFNKALTFSKNHNLDNGIGSSYMNLAEVMIATNNLSTAFEYIDIALQKFRLTKNNIGEAHAMFFKGKIFMDTEDFETAKNFLINAKNKQEIIGDNEGNIRTSIHLATLYWKQDDLAGAKALALSTLNKLSKNTPNTHLEKILLLLSIVCEQNNNYKDALQYFKQHHEASIDISNERLNERLKALRSQISIEQINHEKEIFKLKNVELNTKNKELNYLYNSINNISQIGQELTSTLDLQNVFSRIYKNVNTIMDASTLGIIFVDEDTNTLQYPMFITKNKEMFYPDKSLDAKNSFSSLCIKNDMNIFINNYKEEYKEYDGMTSPIPSIETSQSMLYSPLKFNNKIIGAISVQSDNVNAYSIHNLNMLNALASFISIAIVNARQSEKLSEELEQRVKDQNSLKELNIKLREMTYIDVLTKIPNRRHFVERLTHELNLAKRHNTFISVILVDIDKFKEYNDNYGHSMGDDCLEKVAYTLKNSLNRKSDFVARYGGDEFVVILPETDLDGARLIAETMRKNVEESNIEHNFSSIAPFVSITLGIFSHTIAQDMTLETVIQLADSSLYTAKAQGRNTVAGNINSLAIEKKTKKTI